MQQGVQCSGSKSQTACENDVFFPYCKKLDWKNDDGFQIVIVFGLCLMRFNEGGTEAQA